MIEPLPISSFTAFAAASNYRKITKFSAGSQVRGFDFTISNNPG